MTAERKGKTAVAALLRCPRAVPRPRALEVNCPVCGGIHLLCRPLSHALSCEHTGRRIAWRGRESGGRCAALCADSIA
jgi:hypothetical protein